MTASLLYVSWNKTRVRNGPKKQEINCVNNLKMIGIAFRLWDGDHGDQFPFNVGTNDGGTLEFCRADRDGFDSNAVLHFQVMSNELSTPLLLVCPKDRSKRPAVDFASLQASNVTYLLRSGRNLNDTNSAEVLAVCPIDGNTLFCDGHVEERKVK